MGRPEEEKSVDEFVQEVESVGQVNRASIWEERPQIKEKKSRKRQRSKKTRFRLSASIVAKVIAFFLFTVSFFVGVGALVSCLYMEVEGIYIYNRSVEKVLTEVLYDEAEDMVQRVKNLLLVGNIEGAEELCAYSNASMELLYVGNSDSVIWSTWDGNEADIVVNYHFVFNGTTSINGRIIQSQRLYLMRVHIDPQFEINDEFKQAAMPVIQLYNQRYEIIYVVAAGVLLLILSFVFLMCGAGHRNGQEGIVPGVLTRLPLDVLTVVWGAIALFGASIALEIHYSMSFDNEWQELVYWSSVATIIAVWVMFYLVDFAIRIKQGNCLKHTLIYAVLHWCWRGISWICKGLWSLLCRIPMVATTVIVFMAVAIVEFFGVLIFAQEEALILWFLEKLVVFPLVLYVALACKNLQKAGEALADGQEDYQVDTSKMVGAFKAHGENLNSIGQGITKAVAARMKSEHMKTELITNVSHDIKTPLTSIINYADLICEENSDNEKIAEYSEVLLRQSRRLKKLLEDLVDASKATTGNLEVNLVPCEIGVLLTQAAGEYEQKMEEKSLNLIVRQPEEEVRIMADGRHLWRVFDNLLNNICKYAQEGSRVYLSLETQEDKVVVTFRNMSKYALEISPEELEERFVRGDKSRHMEGNGLGLSIAKSLVELQNGQMEIVIDGDLFKVTLHFKQLAE